MPNTLGITLGVSAAAGSALSVFSNLKGMMGEVAGVTKDLKAKQSALGKEIANAAGQPAEKVKALTEQYERQKKSLEKLREANIKLGKSRAAIEANEQNREKLRGQIMGNIALAYAVIKPLEVGFRLQAAMSHLSARTGLGKQSAGFKALERDIIRLGDTSSYTAGEVAKAAAALSYSLKAEDIGKALPAVATFGAAMQMEAEKAGEMAAGLITAYKIPAADMGKVFDMLAQTTLTTHVKVDQLEATLKEIAPAARQFGMSMADAAAMTGLLGNAGIHGAQAAAALKTVMGKIAGSSTLKKMRVKVSDAAGNFLPLDAIFKAIDKKMKGKGKAAKAALFQEIFGKAGVSAELIAKMSEGGLAETLDKITHADGASAKLALAMDDNLMADVAAVQRAFASLFTTISEGGSSPLRELVQGFTGLVKGINEFLRENPKLAKSIIYGATALVGFRVGLLGACYGLSLLNAPFIHFWKIIHMIGASKTLLQVSGWAAAFPKAAAAVGFLGKAWAGLKGIVLKALPLLGSMAAKAFSMLIGSIGAVGKAMLWLGRVFLLNPIGLAMTLIVAALYLWYKNWDEICSGIQLIGQQLSDFFGGIWDEIKAAFDGGILGIAALILNWSPIGLFYQAFAAVLAWFGYDLPEKFTGFGKMMIEGIINGIGGAAGYLAEKVKSLCAGIADTVKSALGIQSPSRVFARIGGYTMAGLEAGLAATSDGPLAYVKKFAGTIAAAGTLAVSPAMAAMPMAGAAAQAAQGQAAALPQTLPPLKAPMPAASGAAANAGTNTGGNMGATAYQISITAAPGMDEAKLAALVGKKIEDIERQKAARARSRLIDAD